jgi:hypothetical protein
LAVQQLDCSIQVNAEVVQETATAAEELFHQAKQLQETIAFFQVPEALQETDPQLTKLVDTLPPPLDQETLAKISMALETIGCQKSANAPAEGAYQAANHRNKPTRFSVI